MDQTLDRATPESAGIPSGAILEMLDRLESVAAMHSLMVVRHGHVVAEAWWAPNGPDLNQMLFSLSKSFTSTAVGLAISEGYFGLDDAVTSFFPDETPADVNPNLAAMHVRHLLAMCTGHSDETINGRLGLEGENWARTFLSQPVTFAPGTHFAYNTPATYMLSAIVQKRSGLKLIDYLRPRLFDPLGISDPVWEEDPHGINVGGFGLQVRTEDIARFGQLYLQKGVWGGRQLIPAEWVEAATSLQIENAPNEQPDWAQGYGYQFWRGRHESYRGDGAFGQYCLVIPESDLVVAITSGADVMQRILDVIWGELLPALRPFGLPADSTALESLSRRLFGARLIPRPGAASSILSGGLRGAEFTFEQNARELESLRFELDSKGGELIFGTAGGPDTRRLCFGWGTWREGTSEVMPEWQGYPLAASATWPRSDRLEIEVAAYTTPFRYTIAIDFDGEAVRISPSVDVAFGPTELGVLTATRTTRGPGAR